MFLLGQRKFCWGIEHLYIWQHFKGRQVSVVFHTHLSEQERRADHVVKDVVDLFTTSLFVQMGNL